jgi:hypothetical protein
LSASTYESSVANPYAKRLGPRLQPYDEKEAFKLTPQSEARRRKSIEKQAAALGLVLQPAAAG